MQDKLKSSAYLGEAGQTGDGRVADISEDGVFLEVLACDKQKRGTSRRQQGQFGANESSLVLAGDARRLPDGFHSLLSLSLMFDRGARLPRRRRAQNIQKFVRRVPCWGVLLLLSGSCCRFPHSPMMPYQLALIAVRMMGFLRSSTVQSMVWILATIALTARRVLRKISSSVRDHGEQEERQWQQAAAAGRVSGRT